MQFVLQVNFSGCVSITSDGEAEGQMIQRGVMFRLQEENLEIMFLSLCQYRDKTIIYKHKKYISPQNIMNKGKMEV